MRRGFIGAIILSLVLVGEAWPQRRHLTNEDAHHPRLHSGAHSEGGSDEVKVEDLASDCNGLPIEGDASGGATCGSYPSSPDAEYVVGAAHGGLTSEWVLGDDVLFRSANCVTEIDKAVGAICFQTNNAGAWRHEGSNSWIQVAAPSAGSVSGTGPTPLPTNFVLGNDVILIASDCTAETDKPIGAVCLNTGLTRLWRHTGSNTWAEVTLNVQADWNEADSAAASFIQNKPTLTGSTNLAIGSRTDTTLDITSSTGTDATVPEATSTEAGLISAANNVKLGDITRGSNPANLANQNYQWQIASRDISSAASPGVFIGRNTNTANQRAGYLAAQARDGTNNYLWFDNDGKVCKGTTAPDGSDSNCGAVGVDPQIITMVIGSQSNSPGDGTHYFPLVSGAILATSSNIGGTLADQVGGGQNADQGIPFPAGTIETFGFSVGSQLATTTCTVQVTVMDDGSATTLDGTVMNPNRSSDSSYVDNGSETIDAGSKMNVRVILTNCTTQEVQGIAISMNFIPS